MRVMLGTAAAVAAALWAAPAAAQQSIGGGFSISGNGTLTTDYRFRGISQSNEDPALQGSVTVDHQSGFYAGAFASTLGDDRRLGDTEVDLYAGYTREIASGTDLDAGLVYYVYPGGDQRLGATDYIEPYVAISHTLGPVTAEVGAAYAPEQDALAGDDNLYLTADLRGGVPFTPVTVTAHVGHSTGAFAPGGDYLDWRVGLEAAAGPITVALDYVDTDLPDARNVDSALVLSLRFGF